MGNEHLFTDSASVQLFCRYQVIKVANADRQLVCCALPVVEQTGALVLVSCSTGERDGHGKSQGADSSEPRYRVDMSPQ